MKQAEETNCTNWYMRKSGKKWIFGCSVVLLGLFLGGAMQDVQAEDGSVSSTVIVADSTQTTPTEEAIPNQSSSTESNLSAKTEELADPLVETAARSGAQESTVQAESQPVEEETVASQPEVVQGEEQDVTTAEAVPDTLAESEMAVSDEMAETATADLASKEVEAMSAKEEPTNEATSTEAGPSLAKPTENQPHLLKNEVREQKEVTPATEGYKTNLEGLSYDKAVWQSQADGLYSNAVGKGDNFLYSQTKGKNFIFQTDVTFLKNEGAASLTFRSNNDPNDLKNYTVNVDASSHKVKLWRWAEANLIDEKDIAPTKDNHYQLKVIAIDEWISYYVNDVLVANLSDYTMQRNDRGQTTYIPEGYFGLLNWNGEMVFQNTFYTPIKDTETPLIDDVTVTSKTGTVEQKGQFFPKEATHIQYVKNNATTVDLAFATRNPGVVITVTDAAGNIYKDFSNIPLAVGANYLTVTSQLPTASGEVVTVTYRLNIHRRQADNIYYNELYRDQYHYSVKDGWANDPNGLVYYNGTYHMFYQFYDDTKWGPMHWAHATSKDLITWKEEPIAFYPDENGAMFSGCIVVDDKNTSGFFEEGKGGLVALITADGEGQRIKLAYSTDEGKTWTKSDKIAADWSNDPLNNRDFRDPKVFRWEDKWFMVVAGGPLRIYSSDNLKDWTVETTYSDLHTECPDLYPIKASDGAVKWVLSRGGRYYKVGDFKQVDGKWAFIVDADYQDRDAIMNFGKDSYAAMTYYVQDFGSSTNPTLPKLVELNWMNTWDDYCNLVADTVNQKFNGTFNLNLTLGLVKEGNKYVLTQTPIEAYKDLRDVKHAIVYHNVKVSDTNKLFKGFASDTYEIVATFRPGAKTSKVGFDLRVGDNEVTKVIYDLTTETLSLDRSQSGIILSDLFSQVNSQKVTKNADGSIDLHIFVDRASVEVFAKGNTVAGANQIFPAPGSLGLKVFAEGASARADIAVYPLKSIWKDKKTVNYAVDVIQASPKTIRLSVGDKTDLKAYIMPAAAPQNVLWTVANPSLVSLVTKGNHLTVKGLKKGTTTIRATAKENPSLYKEFSIEVFENNFNTNLKDLKSVSGNWYIDGETLYDSNQSANDAYMTSDKLAFNEYEMDVDVKYTKGLVNIFFASASSDPANAYAIQVGDAKSVRLYRFYGDTIAEAPLTAALNDGKYHHIKLIKTNSAVKVLIDNQEVMDYTFTAVDDSFNKPFVGLGLWDGALEVQNFTVKNLHPTEDPDVPKEEKELLDFVENIRSILDKTGLSSFVNLKVSYHATGNSKASKRLTAKVVIDISFPRSTRMSKLLIQQKIFILSYQLMQLKELTQPSALQIQILGKAIVSPIINIRHWW